MKPVIVLVGRPNTGKSTLFNRLTRSRSALVADQPGLTRDRIYGDGRMGDRPYLVVDTGGLTGETEGVDGRMAAQTRQALDEADAVLFLVDGRTGLTSADEVIAEQLRELGKPVWVTVNKAEGMDPDVVNIDFQALGLGQPMAVSATHGDHVSELMAEVLANLPPASEEPPEADSAGIMTVVVGRPNVGKSTLVNRLLGEERVVVFGESGTTRDSVFIPFERRQQRYTLIDTAGVRRRNRVDRGVEKFSVIKALQAVEAAHVAILIIDAQAGVTGQDLNLAGGVVDSGRGLIIAINKWDGLSPDQRSWVKREVDRRLGFADFARLHYISALHGTGVGELFDALNATYQAATRDLGTGELNRILAEALEHNPPPLSRGRRIKLRYAHQGGSNPPLIVVHGTQTEALPAAYRRYLANAFREALDLKGTPVKVTFKTTDNPYEDKPQRLTKRQQDKRRRARRRSRQRYG